MSQISEIHQNSILKRFDSEKDFETKRNIEYWKVFFVCVCVET